MSDPQAPEDVRRLAAELADAQPMRRGSLSERKMKCGQASCRCRSDADARHGPYFSLTRGAAGKTRSRYLSAEQAELVRDQIAAGQQFRQRVDAYWEVCERWADAQLEQTAAAPETEAEKGGSGKHSRRRSSPKSRR